MVDTQFFPPEFKSRLLSFIPDFDAQCDGLLIHSENFQALNLLQERYREQVKCIYIDPPYNTGNDGFIYRDNYQHSSWLSMMEDRLSVSKDLMNDEATIFISIDDNEQCNLKKICDLVFGANNFVGEIIWQTATDNNPSQIAIEHEYVICYANSLPLQKKWLVSSDKALKILNRYKELRLLYGDDIETIQKELRKWVKQNEDLLKGVTHYTYVDSTGVYYPGNSSNTKPGGYSFDIIHPVTKKVCKKPEYGYRWTERTFWEANARGDVDWGNDEKSIPKIKKRIETVTEMLKSYYYEDNRYWTKYLNNLFGRHAFENPKSVTLLTHFLKFTLGKNDFILDFFGGSASTVHSIIQLNALDGGNRKYILVEMGDHFNTVLKPRIEKVVYSPDWKDGKPTSFDKGVSHCFKYIRLESYEDTLNNLELPESDPIASNPKMQPALREDYMLHYLLDTEANASLLDIDMFKNPFGGYRLKIKRPGSEACDETPVDLIETFNYLIGLRVSQYYLPRRYSARFKRAVDPELPGEEGSRRLVLDGRPKLDDAGKWSFLRLEGVVPAHPLNPNNGQTKRVLVIWRNLTGDMEQDNAVLDWFADDLRLNDKVPEYDIVYVNGCNNLGADRKETDSYQVRLIEEEFFRKMLEGRQ